MRLTETSVRALKAPEVGVRVYVDDTLKGFGVRVSQAGAKSFVLSAGKSRDRVTIGRYPIMALAEARKIAGLIKAERAVGRNQTPKIAFGAALQLYGEKHLAKLAPRSKKEIERLFTKRLTHLNAKKLADITAHHITNVTDKISPSEGEHLHRYCKTFFRWCVRRRLLQHSPIEGLELPSTWIPRERVLSDAELSTLWEATDAVGGHFGAIVKLLALTGQRRGEITALQAAYITDNSICLPKELTKNRRAHTFPISARCAAILRSNITKATTSLFPARGKPNQIFNGWSKSTAQLKAKVIELAPGTGTDWTLHDLRRTYATNLQRLGIRLEVIEALLNHVSGTRAGIVGVYQRHHYADEMRDAVEKFEEWFQRTIVDEADTEMAIEFGEPEWV
jgi:integrase